MRILVLEDDEGDFLLLKKTLERTELKAELVHTERLKDALEELKNGQFDLILSDLSVPDSQGLETVEQLLEENNVSPIIVLTGLKDEDVGLAAIRRGAQDYLNKGEITDDLLKRVIRYAVERKGLDRMKDDFVSSVSHELRTPLTVMRERVSQMLDGILGETTEKQVKALNATSRNIERLENIINNLLDIAKINAGKMDLHKENTNIVDLVEEVVEGLAFKAKEKGLELRKNTSKENVEIAIDRTKIYQALINLINNALKFTDEGFVEIGINDFPDKIELIVKDSGRGMSQEDLKKLYNKFEQFGSNVENTEGTGLGLAITKGLTELHNGSIDVQSKEGEGTQFKITLPKE